MPGSRPSIHGGVQVAGVHPAPPNLQKDRRVEPRNSDPGASDREVSGELSETGRGCGERRSGSVGEVGGQGGVDGGGIRWGYDEGDEERRRGNGAVVKDRNELQ